MNKKYKLLLLLLLALGSSYAQESTQFLKEYLEELKVAEKLLTEDSQWELLRSHTSSTSGVLHMYFIQTVEGIPVAGTESSLHIDSQKNRILAHNSFIKNIRSGFNGNYRPALSGLDAVNRAVSMFAYPLKDPIQILQISHDGKKMILSDANFFEDQIRPELKFILDERQKLLLVWDFLLAEPGNEHYWRLHIDAINGQIVYKEDEMIFCGIPLEMSKANTIPNYNFNPYPPADYSSNLVTCTNCYEIFAEPLESPYDGERIIVQDPADPIASPFGWHEVYGYVLRDSQGNNADVYIEEGEYNIPYRAYGGEASDYTGFEFGNEYDEFSPYTDAAITNVFYWINYLHDITYRYGFDEVAGNFQYQNYGNGGEEEDQITAVIQRSDFCNASIRVSSMDGFKPYISLFTCDTQDGAFDNTVIMHEFGHGLLRRLAGSCLNVAETIEEGWCDYYGALLTLKPEDNGAQGKAIGNYLFGQGIDGPGVRQYPYSTDFSVNPETYGSVNDYEKRHRIGAVWGEMMWEMTWSLIDDYGFDPDYRNFTGIKGVDAGNIMAMAISVEALKLLACRGGFVDARNAIIKAARVLYGDEMECEMWPSFAKRGIGYSAEQGDPYKTDDQVEAFDLPPMLANFSEEGFDLCGIYEVFEELGGGNPTGGIYSGPGVTDNGDGFTYTFNPYEAGPGIHKITYTIEDSPCTVASSDFIEITVNEDNEAPFLKCPETILVEIWEISGFPKIPLLRPHIEFSDNCGEDSVELIQEPAAGTFLDVQNPPVIMLIARDNSGNESFCAVKMTIDLIEVNNDTEISLYPNPSEGTVNVTKSSANPLISASVYSVTGELVKHYDLQQVENETILVMENLRTGVYFIRFLLESEEVIKYILIE